MSYLRSMAVLIFLADGLLPFILCGQELKIKPGDAIRIEIYNYKELSQTVVVSPDGMVDFPFIQEVPVDGITLQRFQEILVAQLSRYMDRSPLVSVRFTETYPVKVTVLGQVAKPGIYLVANTSTLQGAIGEAGGFIPGALLSKIKLIRGEEKNGDYLVVNMEKFYLEGELNYLPALKDGDTIVVPGNPLATSVKVLGGVTRPGSYEVSFQTSLLDILFMAGGPANDANLSNVKVLSRTGQNSQFNMRNMLNSKNLDTIPLVAPGDIVYVPQRKITWRKLVNLARDLSVFVAMYATIYWISRTNWY